MGHHNRFWPLGTALVLFNMGYMGYNLVVLKEQLGILGAIFHGTLLLVAVSLFNLKVGKYWGDKLVKLAMFWRKGNLPADTPTETQTPEPPVPPTEG